MSNEIVLRRQKIRGPDLQAIILPEQGMTLKSFRSDNVEVISQNRADSFAKCGKGYGPIIGPHFNEYRNIPALVIEHAELWPQTPALRELGVRDLWQHGVGRYVPWQYEAGSHSISAVLRGSDTFNGFFLRDIQGGDFEMRLRFDLLEDSLQISMEAAADFPPCIGLHYYYALPLSHGRVRAPIRGNAFEHDRKVNIPASWIDPAQSNLDVDLNQPLDHLFPLRSGRIELATRDYRLWTIPEQGVESLVIFHPESADFVCVEPLAPELPFRRSAKEQKFSVRLCIEATRKGFCLGK